MRVIPGLFYVRLAAHVANGWKFLIRPSSGKDTAKTKGVVGDHESEGRWRQISGLTNRNHMRLELSKRSDKIHVSQSLADIVLLMQKDGENDDCNSCVFEMSIFRI